MSPIIAPGRIAEAPTGLLSDALPTGGAAIMAAARLLLPTIERGTALDARTLRSAMETAFGATDADGAWVWKDAYEVAECAMVLFLSKYGKAMRGQARDDAEFLALVERLSALMPSQTRRSEESEALQQFSTPLGLALCAAIAADIGPNDTVLEPSAGNGFMAIWAKIAGATLHLNELSDTRADCLASLFSSTGVTRLDAAQIDDRLDRAIVPDVVLMNPPFSVGANIEGKYRRATLAHVRSALLRLREGGRLVTVTGASFSPYEPRWRDAFVALQRIARVQLTLPIAGKLYARHGTSIDTRLTVFDKVPTDDPTSFHASFGLMETTEQLREVIAASLPKRQQRSFAASTTALKPTPVPYPTGTAARSTGTFLSPKAKARPKIDPAAFALTPTTHKLDRTATAPVAYERQVWSPSASLDAVDALYEPYAVQSIAIEGAKAHPTKLVQSGAMASIAPPVPSYVPTLPAAIVTDGLLSDAQIESVIYAGEAHDTHLAGHYRVGDTFDTVDACDKGTQGAVRFRRGWFLGDGTGCGKGRQVAGIIMANWLDGRCRAVWVSKSDKLIEDAIRDWTALGGAKSDIVPLSGFKQGSPITIHEGILFTTYATLRTQSKGGKLSRVEQIAEWLQPSLTDEVRVGVGEREAGKDGNAGGTRKLFDGCLIFDESHAMANAASSKGSRGEQRASQQGLAGLRIQNALPDARVVYVSATGATQVSNLAYASRLGLWGTGDFPFATREKFVAAMEAGGVAAMEVISRDLKALGLYTARSLSYDGVEYETLTHELTDRQRAIYDSYADAYQIIHQNLDAAMEAAGITHGEASTLNAQAKSAVRSAFESSKQRFFNHLLTAMKVPTLIQRIETELAAGNAAVVQVVSTGEALMERRIAEIPADQWSDLDVDITPREYVLDYLASSFPVQLFEPYTDDDGNLRSRPARDPDGHPIVCRDAERRRDAMIEHLGALPAVNGAMDQLIWHFGADQVAEVTGRSRRVVKKEDGRLAIEPRPASSNYGETAAFMDDAKRILIFSDAGGTGRSYHADLGAKNQRKRVHFLLEPGWKADSAIQGLGRTNRTNQKQEPLFVLVTTDVKGEKRFVSTIARRLDTLGAITRGSRQTGGQGMFTAADNLESPYARAALRRFFHRMLSGNVDGCSLDEFEEMTGLSLFDADGGVKDEMPAITQFLNRMLALTIDMQNLLFGVFTDILDGIVEQAKASGSFDVGVETLRAERFEIVERRSVFSHASGAEAIALTIERTTKTHLRSLASAIEDARAYRGKLVLNAKSERAAVLYETVGWTDEQGNPVPRVKLVRPRAKEGMGVDQFTDSEWTFCDPEPFERAWQAEVDATPEFETDTFTLVTGLLLPIWGALPTDDMRVWRLEATGPDGKGERVLGRVIEKDELASVLRKLGHDVEVSMTGAELREAVFDRRATVTLADDVTIRRSLNMGAPRIEVVGFDGLDLASYKAMGCTTERVQFKTRLYVPLPKADDTLAKLVARHPIADVRGSGA